MYAISLGVLAPATSCCAHGAVRTCQKFEAKFAEVVTEADFQRNVPRDLLHGSSSQRSVWVP